MVPGRAVERAHRSKSPPIAEKLCEIARPSHIRFPYRGNRHEERAHTHHAQPKALRNDRAPPAQGAELLAARLLRIMLPCPRPRQTERIPNVPGTRGATMQG